MAGSFLAVARSRPFNTEPQPVAFAAFAHVGFSGRSPGAFGGSVVAMWVTYRAEIVDALSNIMDAPVFIYLDDLFGHSARVRESPNQALQATPDCVSDFSHKVSSCSRVAGPALLKLVGGFR